MLHIFNIISFIFITTHAFSNTNNGFFENNKPLNLPVILSKEDIKIYRSIFILHNRGQWSEANKLKNSLSNNILQGYLEYDKLMHPNKYKASYQELAYWFENYKDFPPVLRRRIHALLIKRLPQQMNKDKYQKPKFGKYLRGYGEDRRKKLIYNIKKPVKKKIKEKNK